MIIVLLLFFKSICLYCQRLVLHIHDRWINPENVRLLKEAAEAKGSKFQIEDYRQVKKSKKRRHATNSSSNSTASSLADSRSCRFCANTPQGYCRHHFHLQELHVQKQQRQQKFWCPLSGVVGGSNRSTDYRQLRKIKRELKRNIQHQQQLKLTKVLTSFHETATHTTNYPPSSLSSPPSTSYPQSNSDNSSDIINSDSGYQTFFVNTTSSSLESAENIELPADSDSASVLIDSNSFSPDYVDIELPSSSASLVETTYSFETCCETPLRSHSPLPIPRTTSFNSFVSCEY